jgi:uncharacterized protein YecT (DUF1311 family)
MRADHKTFVARARCTAARGAAGALLAVLLAAPGHSQTAADCTAPRTQSQMTACALHTYAQTDAALNAAWKSAMFFADAIGQGGPLLEAQRAWLHYRDAACEVHASPYQGGSLQPMIRADCLSDLTAARTRMLRDFNAY